MGKGYCTGGELNDRQELFCRYYVGEAHYVATKAAKMAGYSEKTAYIQGHHMLKKPKILTRIKELHAAKGITPEHIESEIAKIAFNDPRLILESLDTNKGKLEMDEDADLRVVQSVRLQNGKLKSVEVRFHDKTKALELLSKIHAMLTTKLEHSGHLTIAELAAGIEDDTNGTD